MDMNDGSSTNSAHVHKQLLCVTTKSGRSITTNFWSWRHQNSELSETSWCVWWIYTVSQKNKQNYFLITTSNFHQIWQFLA